MKNSKILIVEDEVVIAEHLKLLLNKSGYKEVAIADSLIGTMVVLEEFKPELALLDVRLNGKMEGIEVAKYLNNHHPIPYLYITAHSDEAVLSSILETKPSAYISKPFKSPDVLAAVNIALHKTEKDLFHFKHGFEEIMLDKKEILFVKSEKNYIDIFCSTKKYTVRKPLDWFLQEIHCEHFIRVHRSFVVNKLHARRFSAGSLSIQDFKIPVSRNHFSEVKELFKGK